MKKLLRIGILCGVLTLLLCVGALAVGEKGIYDIGSESGFTVTATGSTTEVTTQEGTKAVYLNVEQVTVHYTHAVASKNYLLVVTSVPLEGETKPTDSNIQYINQDAVLSDGEITFTVSPKTLSNGMTYYIYLVSDDGTLSSLTAGGTFKYYAAYIVGDANGNNQVTSQDALYILQMIAGAVNMSTVTDNQKAAADANVDGKINAQDALFVLQKVAG